MPRKRDVLQALKRDELVDAADWFEVPVRDRRVRDDVIDALAASRKAGLPGILEGLSRSRLKEVCRALDLDGTGREKAVLIARLAGQDGHAPARKPAAEAPAFSRPSGKGTDSAEREGGGSLSRAAGEGRGGGLRPRTPTPRSEERMEQAQLNWITGFIWNIAVWRVLEGSQLSGDSTERQLSTRDVGHT